MSVPEERGLSKQPAFTRVFYSVDRAGNTGDFFDSMMKRLSQSILGSAVIHFLAVSAGIYKSAVF